MDEEALRALVAKRDRAVALGHEGDPAGGASLARDALEGFRGLVGDHVETFHSECLLASMLCNAGDTGAAWELFEQALEGSTRVLGADHPQTLTAMSGLAAVTAARGDLRNARQRFEETLAARRRVLGEEHVDTLRSTADLAELLTELGEHAEALRIGEDTLRVARQALGDEHPQALRAMIVVAGAMYARGELDPARRLSDEAFKANHAVLGESHPQTLRAMRLLGVTLWAQGDLLYARPLLERLLELSKMTFGEDHPNTLRAMYDLAGTVGRQGGQLDRAEKLLEQALEGQRRVLGEEHGDTLRSMDYRAAVLAAGGGHEKAREQAAQALEASRRGLGEEHAETVARKAKLAALGRRRVQLGRLTRWMKTRRGLLYAGAFAGILVIATLEGSDRRDQGRRAISNCSTTDIGRLREILRANQARADAVPMSPSMANRLRRTPPQVLPPTQFLGERTRGRAVYFVAVPRNPGGRARLRFDFGDGSSQVSVVPRGRGFTTVEVGHAFGAPEGERSVHRQRATLVETGLSASARTVILKEENCSGGRSDRPKR